MQPLYALKGIKIFICELIDTQTMFVSYQAFKVFKI